MKLKMVVKSLQFERAPSLPGTDQLRDLASHDSKIRQLAAHFSVHCYDPL